MRRIQLLKRSGLLLLLLCSCYTLIPLSPHRSSWQLVEANTDIQTFELVGKGLGDNPKLFWLTEPTRLLFAPSNWYSGSIPQEKANIWVANLETGQKAWYKAQDLPMSQFVSGISKTSFKLPNGKRIRVKLSTWVIPIWRPRIHLFSLGFGSGGDPAHIRFVKLYTGWVRLTVRQGFFGPILAEYSQTLSYESPLPTLGRLTHISPDGKYLLFNPERPISDSRVFVIGLLGDRENVVQH